MPSATVLEPVDLVISESFEVIRAKVAGIDLNQSICIEVNKQSHDARTCLRLKSITKQRKHGFDPQATSKDYIEFPWVVDVTTIQQKLQARNLNKVQQRQFLQSVAKKLSELSVKAVDDELNQLKQTKQLGLIPIVINNSLLITNAKDKNKRRATTTEGSERPAIAFPDSQPIVGIIDSGVSQYHNLLANADVVQYNPVENSDQIKDTAFGHATAILSLLAVDDNSTSDKRLINQGKYLSCNGLPNAKYSFQSILQCMNWFFLEPRVDVIVNAWSAPRSGCIDAWRDPITMLFYTHTVPVFAAGNYANEKAEGKGMNRSPANLNFSNVGFTSLTVGALNSKNRRLASSSFGESSCRLSTEGVETKIKNNANNKAKNKAKKVGAKNNHSYQGVLDDKKHFQANLFAKGEGLTVAVPFTKTSFQKVEGTSYAVVFVAAAVANLTMEFPNAGPKKISEALLSTAKTAAPKPNTTILYNELGYGVLDYEKARQQLLKEFTNSKVTTGL